MIGEQATEENIHSFVYKDCYKIDIKPGLIIKSVDQFGHTLVLRAPRIPDNLVETSFRALISPNINDFIKDFHFKVKKDAEKTDTFYYSIFFGKLLEGMFSELISQLIKGRPKEWHFHFGIHSSQLDQVFLFGDIPNIEAFQREINGRLVIKEKFSIKFEEIPRNTKTNDIHQLLHQAGFPVEKVSFATSTKNKLTQFGYIDFKGPFDVKKAMSVLYSRFPPFEVTLSRGRKLLKPGFFAKDKCKKLIHYDDTSYLYTDFLKIKRGYPNLELSFKKEFNFLPGLYDIDSLLEPLVHKYQSRLTYKKNVDHLMIQSQDPKIVLDSFSLLNQEFNPLIINFATEEQLLMLSELNSQDLFSRWDSEKRTKSLIIEKEPKKLYELNVYGTQLNKGQLLKNIMDYQTMFVNRYWTFSVPMNIQEELEMEINNTFIKKKALPRGSFIKIDNDGLLKIYIFENNKDSLSSYIRDVQTIIGSKTRIHDKSICPKCNNRIRNKFKLCKHDYCKFCLNNQIQTANGDISLLCEECKSPISIEDLVSAFDNEETFLGCVKAIINSIILQNPERFPHLCTCLRCKDVINRIDGYMKCPFCGTGQCHKCKAVDNPYHEGAPCSVSEHKLSIESMIADSITFAQNNWPLSGQRIRNIFKNESILSGSPSIQKFADAIQRQSLSILETLTFVWHGTKGNAIPSICYNGFDPSYRRGQAYGPGEYFGLPENPGVSLGYCDSSQMIIVAAILLINGVTKKVNNFCYVVNNPSSFEYSYCIPLCVVDFSTNKNQKIPEFFMCKPPLEVSLFKNINSRSKRNTVALFQWHWEMDNRTMEPYPESINIIIEENYNLYKMNQGPAEYLAKNIVRYQNDVPQDYTINYIKNIQINVKTGYTRNIQRRKTRLGINAVSKWQFMNDKDQLEDYQSTFQSIIEDMYQSYKNDSGRSKVDFHFPGRPEEYQLDFIRMLEMNKVSKKQRSIYREEI